jgi:hypothetical protein
MPRQNRVTPFGEIIATPERGTVMGNRGVIHDRTGRIRRPWQVKRWLVCVLQFKGRRRKVMTPGWYTELFFFDEATALAAGHRPCAECQRERFNAFRDAWSLGIGVPTPTAGALDEQLHAERLTPNDAKRTFRANLASLPNGVFVVAPKWGQTPHLVWDNGVFAWSAGGYEERRARPHTLIVDVLTPKSTVAAIGAGYVPDIHHSVPLT